MYSNFLNRVLAFDLQIRSQLATDLLFARQLVLSAARVTEMVCFRLDEALALDKVEQLGADRDAVQGLPLGSFIAWNRLLRGLLDKKVC